MPFALPVLAFVDDAVDAVTVLLEFVEGEVVLDEEKDDEGGADADGEADDVDEGEDFVTPEVADGGSEVVAEHSFS